MPEVNQGEELFASVDGIVASLSNRECVFQPKDNGESHAMTVDVLQAMDLCRSFQPLAQHIQAIEQRIPALKGQAAAINTVLQFLIDRKLMVPASGLVSSVLSKTDSITPPEQVLIRTCDSPARIEQLLNSAVDNKNKFGRDWQFLLVDDSRSSASQQRNQALVGDAVSKGLSVRYLGWDWRNAFSSWIEKAMPQHAELLNWLCFQQATGTVSSHGRLWNAMNLLMAGKPYLTIGEDTLLRAKSWSGDQAQLSLHHQPLAPIRFAGDFSELEQQLVTAEGDPLIKNALVIGNQLGAALGNLNLNSLGASSLQGLDWRFVNQVFRGERVMTSSSGAYGDSRMDSTLWFYLQSAENSAAFWQSSESYFRQLSRPMIAQGYQQLYLTDLSELAPTAVDASSLVPFTAPTASGDSLMFSMVMRYLYPRASVLHLPEMLANRKSDSYQAQPAELFTPNISRFLAEMAFYGTEECAAESPADRLYSLAQKYRDLANASSTRKVSAIRQFLTHTRANVVEQLQQNLLAVSDKAPEYWTTDARDWVGEHAKMMTNADDLRFGDWPSGLSSDAAATMFQQTLQRFASAAQAWPEIWKHCYGRFDEIADLS